MFRILSVALFIGMVARAHAADVVDFNQDIRPILSDNCFACHGPDASKRASGVRLDQAGEADLEQVLARITTDDPDLVMPPPESHKHLTEEKKDLLKRWVEAGAPYAEHWSFVPPREPELPVTARADWSDQAIDRFVLARLERKGLGPSQRADKRTLIRRVTFDLTGLPPTVDEIHAFLADDSPEAYEQLVDRLLSRPAYGEHGARYWLDLVRFADTNGLHHDHYREMSPYRDWVIRSFNANTPFDAFITDQVAGDLHPEPTTDQLIASGFNRLHLIIDVGTALPEESFNRNVVDRVSAVGTAFLGLTLQCAVCHDHKFDPITQRDFYQFYAFFNNLDVEPETGRRGGTDFLRGLQPPYINLPSPEQKNALAKIDREIDRLAARLRALDDDPKKKSLGINGESRRADGQFVTADSETKDALSKRLAGLERDRDDLLLAIPAALVAKERREVRPAYIKVRGNYDSDGDLALRDTPGFLPPLPEKNGARSRMDLARWMVDPSNPLTARVAVNRFWQQFFGTGLVKTSEDFGAQGEAPSHPELLDYLTLRFVESGWDVKGLLRSIVLSETYQQSTKAPRDAYVADPQNRMLARGSRFRMDGEMVRDQLLAVTGLLNTTMYGKSIKVPQPAGLWDNVTMPWSYPKKFEADKGDAIYRRTVYSFWKRALPPPQMTIFDAPTRESCIARRERTNTPLQALLLMNEEQYFAAAMHYAKGLSERTDLDARQKLLEAHEAITSQLPSASSLAELEQAWIDFQTHYTIAAAEAEAMLALSSDPGTRAINDPRKRADLAAWTMVVHSLLNLDATKTRE